MVFRALFLRSFVQVNFTEPGQIRKKFGMCYLTAKNLLIGTELCTTSDKDLSLFIRRFGLEGFLLVVTIRRRKRTVPPSTISMHSDICANRSTILSRIHRFIC